MSFLSNSTRWADTQKNLGGRLRSPQKGSKRSWATRSSILLLRQSCKSDCSGQDTLIDQRALVGAVGVCLEDGGRGRMVKWWSRAGRNQKAS